MNNQNISSELKGYNFKDNYKKDNFYNNLNTINIKNNEVFKPKDSKLEDKKIQKQSESDKDKKDELIKELLEKVKNHDKEFNKLKKSFRIVYHKQKKSEDKIKKLTEVIVNKVDLIDELQFNLKIIGLRTAYQSLIDLFIHIFGLNGDGNLISKVSNLKKYLNKDINRKKESNY